MEAALAMRAPDGVVFFSIFDWWYHSHGHSDFQLGLALARSQPVLFVNSIGMRMPTPGKTPRPLRRVYRKMASAARLVRAPRTDLSDFRVFTPVFLPLHGPGLLPRINARSVGAQARVLCRSMGIRNPIRIFTPPTALPALRGLGSGPLVYNRSDRHSAFGEVGPWIAELEREALGAADVVAYASSELAASEREVVGERGLHLEHSVDARAFHPEAPPDPEIAAIEGIKVGFCGDLREHAVDFDRIEAVARALPHVSFVLVGDPTSSVSRLAEIDNVHLLAPRPFEAMPGCWSALDVAFMPYRKTPWTSAIQPIKLKEVLAVGLPIVGTDIPALTRLGARAFTSGETDALVAALRTLTQSRAELRRQDPSPWIHPTWDEQAERLMERVEGVARHAEVRI